MAMSSISQSINPRKSEDAKKKLLLLLSDNSNDNNGSLMSHIQTLMESGNKQAACDFAVTNNMWAHALIISSHIDQKKYMDVVVQFSRSISSEHIAEAIPEPLRVLYGIFAGAGVEAGINPFYNFSSSTI
jgi:hypothetical protein